jgi:hypothetical protein
MKTILVIGFIKLDMKLEAKLSKKKLSEGLTNSSLPIGPSNTAKLNGCLFTLPEKGDTLNGIKNKLKLFLVLLLF